MELAANSARKKDVVLKVRARQPPSSQRIFVPFSSLVTPAPAVHPDQPTGVSLAEPCFFSHDTHRFSLRPRAYHFFASTTFSASRSSACCATIFFSRPFSSST